jgi:transcriptional regulator with XRE-family HTH domain
VPTFSEYLLSKLQEFEKQRGQRTTLDKFAEYLGVKRPILSIWLSGKSQPSLDSVRQLAEVLGPEVYEVLDLPRPNPYLQKITQLFENLSPEHQRKLAEDAEFYKVENIEKHIHTTSQQRKKRKAD